MDDSPTESLKLFGIPAQIDFGNFAVGVATAAIALVSLYIAVRSTKSDNKKAIAEFRQLWIDDLRSNIADFVGCIEEAANIAFSHQARAEYHRELDQIFGRIRTLEAYIRLKLYDHEIEHRYIIALISEIRGRISIYASTGKNAVTTDINEIIDILIDMSRVVLKREWNRVTIEVLGKRRNFSLSDLWSKIRGVKTFEEKTKERARQFFLMRSITP
ncbi:hypothetical protein [Methylobacterium marchantiae]|uniref:DUF4760 domain-containing protein n=1 Tax=Methylobacterium marchantiae TaxID=600331 RepID=A0ABW3X3N3_9HYPH|nr:hypothetical protein AIGOOFII_0289 [Methylobacterium marchantiae]